MKFLNFTDTYSLQMIEKFNCWIVKVEDKSGAVKFPIKMNRKVSKKLSKSSCTSALLLLDELYEEGILQVENGVYRIPSEQFWSLEDDERETLSLPKAFSGEVKLESDLAVGIENFKVVPYIKREDGQWLRSFVRKGHIIRYDGGTRVLNSEQQRLFDSVAKVNKVSIGMEQFRALAELKTAAKFTDVTLDNYLESEEIIFAEGFDIEIDVVNPSELNLNSKFKSLDFAQNQLINDNPTKTYYNQKTSDTHSRKVFIDETEREKVSKLNEIKKIKGSDVPKFLRNPIPFIGNEFDFDLSEFSERVKGIKIITYKAQPFVKVNETDKLNWFDYGVGVRLDPNNEDLDSKELDIKLFEKLIDEAKKNGGFARIGDEWIEIDLTLAKKFINAVRSIESESNNKPIDGKGLQQILEIFENIQQLEYNQGYFVAVEKIKKFGLDRYYRPEGFKADLYGYQKEGHQWMRSLDAISAGGLMADDMGLGKTVQLISFLQYLKNHGMITPTLIVLPAALIDNWLMELERFSSGIVSRVYHRAYGALPKKFREYDVFLTTYETLVSHQVELGKVDWQLIVCDEAQKIKNASTFASNAVKALKANRRIALTGTPVENNLSELWSIMDFVQPGLLGCYKSFRKNYEVPIQMSRSQESVDALLDIMKPVYIRRTKTEKLSGLPSIHEIRTNVKMGNLQQQLYLEQIILGKKNKRQRLPAINRMIAVSSHPRASKGDISIPISILINESPKLQETLRILDEIKAKNQKVIIFTKLRNMQSIFRRVIFDRYNIDPKIINGQTKGNRNLIIDKFSKLNGFNVIILSPKAAGVGLNFTAANHVIHYTRDWNPAVEKQATDRVFRIGQLKDVSVYYPTVTTPFAESVEEKLDRLIEKKKALIEQVVVSREQFRELDDKMMDMLFNDME